MSEYVDGDYGYDHGGHEGGYEGEHGDYNAQYGHEGYHDNYNHDDYNKHENHNDDYNKDNYDNNYDDNYGHEGHGYDHEPTVVEVQVGEGRAIVIDEDHDGIADVVAVDQDGDACLCCRWGGAHPGFRVAGLNCSQQ